MKKAGRNDPCPCGSGKKFKKCCEATMIKGRFTATKLDQDSAPQIQKAVGLTSLFQASTLSIPKKTLPPLPAPESAVEPSPETLPAQSQA